MNNQSLYLHGPEQRILKWVPKPLYIIVERIKIIAPASELVSDHFSDFLATKGEIQGNETLLEIQADINKGDFGCVSEVSDIRTLIHVMLLFLSDYKNSMLTPMLVQQMSSVADWKNWSDFIATHLDLETLMTLNYTLDILRKV
jgi:hypothetical protein